MEETLQPTELQKVFRETLRARRLEQGISQADLAKSLGMSQSFIAQLESGSRVPNLEHLAMLADALNTTPDSLLRRDVFQKISA